jgi:hypothetical protein
MGLPPMGVFTTPAPTYPPGWTGPPTAARPQFLPPGGFSGMMPPPGMHGPMTDESGGNSKPLQEVSRIRTLFPETWLWMNRTTG